MATGNSNSQTSPFWEWLQNMFSRDEESAGASPDVPPRRGLIITVCLLVSAFLWFTYTIRGTYTATISMPTLVQGLPDGEALVSLPPERVRVQVEGDGISLIRLNYTPLTIPIDASNDVVNLEDAVREIPKNVRITSVSPATFNLQKEPSITRTIPIRSLLDIRTPDSYNLLDPPELQPDSVRVTGAASIVSRLSSWPTEERVYRDVRDSLVTTVQLADTLQGLVRKSVQATRVRAQVGRFTDAVRTIPVNVVGGPERAVTLEPSSVVVRFNVLFSQHDEAINAPDFFATVSYDTILSDTTGRIVPTLHEPTGVTMRDVRMIPSSLRYFQRLE